VIHGRAQRESGRENVEVVGSQLSVSWADALMVPSGRYPVVDPR
jgi:hypothetical protein